MINVASTSIVSCSGAPCSSQKRSRARACAWWHEPFRYLWAEQPFTFTPEYATSWIEHRYSPTGPSANALRYLTMLNDCLAWTRIEMALASVIAQLRAGAHWGAIAAEGLENAAPLTAMGKLDHAFFAERKVASHA